MLNEPASQRSLTGALLPAARIVARACRFAPSKMAEGGHRLRGDSHLQRGDPRPDADDRPGHLCRSGHHLGLLRVRHLDAGRRPRGGERPEDHRRGYGQLRLHDRPRVRGSVGLKRHAGSVIVGLFAALLGLHNSTSRYMFALGRVHRPYGSPFVASLTVGGIEILVVSVSALAGIDRFIQLGAVTGAITSFGLELLQAFAAVSVIGFFWRRPDRSWVRTVILPGVGAAGLFIASYFIMRDFSVLTGLQVGWINSLPWIVIGIGVVGVLYALWLRSARKETYDNIVRTIEVRDGTVPAAVYEE